MKLLKIFLLISMISFLSGCRSCDREEAKPKANASFAIGQMLGTGGDFPYRFIANDTIETYFGWGVPLYGVTVHFKAEDTTMDQYEWKVGSDDRIFTKRLFGLDFKMPGIYPVKLKVYKKSGATTLVDSITKTFILEQRPLPRLYGKWRGSLSFKPDSLFDIWICSTNGQLDSNFNWILDSTYTPFGQNGFSNILVHKFLTPIYSADFNCLSKMGDLNEIQIFNSPWFGKNLYFIFNNSSNRLTIEFRLQKRYGSLSTPFINVTFTGIKVK
jgi:hypothetical protein